MEQHENMITQLFLSYLKEKEKPSGKKVLNPEELEKLYMSGNTKALVDAYNESN